MNQLIIYVLQGLFVGIFNRIDTSFGNNISIDAICVLSAYTVITWITSNMYHIGSYSYRILMDKVKNCLLVTCGMSLIVAIVIFLLSDKIPLIYSLTNEQRILFTKCLIVHSMSIPFLAIGGFMKDYILLNCMNKLMWISNVLFYVVMIFLDIVVVVCGYDLDYLLWTTLMSYIVYDILTISVSGILKSQEKITLCDIKLCIKHGLNMLTDKLFGKIAVVFYNVYASKLGTETYAIHSICYSIAVFTEDITNALFNYQVVNLSKYDNADNKYRKCLQSMKHSLLPLVVVSYFASFVLLFVMHGDVDIKLCIFPLILYCLQCFFLQFYESLRGYLTSLKRSDLLKWAGIIAIVTRIPIILISYHVLNIGIYGFALATNIDYIFRGLYLYVCHLRIKQRKC